MSDNAYKTTPSDQHGDYDHLNVQDTSVQDIIHQDIVDILNALGLGDHARPISMHEIVQTEIVPEIHRLKATVRVYTEESTRRRQAVRDKRYDGLS